MYSSDPDLTHVSDTEHIVWIIELETCFFFFVMGNTFIHYIHKFFLINMPFSNWNKHDLFISPPPKSSKKTNPKPNQIPKIWYILY